MNKSSETTKDQKKNLILAEGKAKELFKAVEDLGSIVPGKSERELSDEIVTKRGTAGNGYRRYNL